MALAAISSHATSVYTREVRDENIWHLEVPGPHGKISSPTADLLDAR
jgi:hypothetical protein